MYPDFLDKIVNFSKLPEFSRSSFVKWISQGYFPCINRFDQNIVIQIYYSDQPNIITISRSQYLSFLQSIYRDSIGISITNCRNKISQIYLSIFGICIISLIIPLYHYNYIFRALIVINISIKIIILLIGMTRSKRILNDELSNISEDYSILIPFYKEDNVVLSLINNISALVYPTQMLYIKIIVEEDDFQTINALQNIQLPAYCDVLFVPNILNHNKTKPRALNYAMHFVDSKMITIYDAEDIPNKLQLLQIVNEHKYNDCHAIQVPLQCYNYQSSLISLFSALEYIQWFEIMSNALSKMNIQIPLGGTSNHISRDAINKMNLWDSDNVTEDTELSLELLRHGIKTHITYSGITKEETVITLFQYIKQRSRWMKGHIITFMTFILRNGNNLKMKDFLWSYYFCLSHFISSILLPYIIIDFLWHPNHILTILSLIQILIAYYVMKKRYQYNRLKAMMISLIYFIFLSVNHIISIISIIEIMIGKAALWHKTDHKLIYKADVHMIS